MRARLTQAGLVNAEKIAGMIEGHHKATVICAGSVGLTPVGHIVSNMSATSGKARWPSERTLRQSDLENQIALHL
jgi:hypothetical protein